MAIDAALAAGDLRLARRLIDVLEDASRPEPSDGPSNVIRLKEHTGKGTK